MRPSETTRAILPYAMAPYLDSAALVRRLSVTVESAPAARLVFSDGAAAAELIIERFGDFHRDGLRRVRSSQTRFAVVRRMNP